MSVGRTLPLALTVATLCACGGGTSTNTLTAPSAATRCQLAAAADPLKFAASGGLGAVTVNATRECGWSATTSANWILIEGAKQGQGEGRVTYSVAPNGLQQARRGIIDVSGQRIELTQAAAPPPPPPAPEPVPSPQPNPAPAPNPPAPPDPAPAPNPPPAPNPSPAPNPAPAPGPTSPAPNPPPSDDEDEDEDDDEDEGDDDEDDDDDGTVGGRVDLTGNVQLVSGSCPSLALRIADTSVVTDRNTQFKKVKCGDLREGMRVEVRGTWQADRTVLTEKIERR